MYIKTLTFSYGSLDKYYSVRDVHYSINYRNESEILQWSMTINHNSNLKEKLVQ